MTETLTVAGLRNVRNWRLGGFRLSPLVVVLICHFHNVDNRGIYPFSLGQALGLKALNAKELESLRRSITVEKRLNAGDRHPRTGAYASIDNLLNPIATINRVASLVIRQKDRITYRKTSLLRQNGTQCQFNPRHHQVVELFRVWKGGRGIKEMR